MPAETDTVPVLKCAARREKDQLTHAGTPRLPRSPRSPGVEDARHAEAIGRVAAMPVWQRTSAAPNALAPTRPAATRRRIATVERFGAVAAADRNQRSFAVTQNASSVGVSGVQTRSSPDEGGPAPAALCKAA